MRQLGLIVLAPLGEFDHPISLAELRANGVEFKPALQQGRG
jgi:hypothetical protein